GVRAGHQGSRKRPITMPTTSAAAAIPIAIRRHRCATSSGQSRCCTRLFCGGMGGGADMSMSVSISGVTRWMGAGLSATEGPSELDQLQEAFPEEFFFKIYLNVVYPCLGKDTTPQFHTQRNQHERPLERGSRQGMSDQFLIRAGLDERNHPG